MSCFISLALRFLRLHVVFCVTRLNDEQGGHVEISLTFRRQIDRRRQFKKLNIELITAVGDDGIVVRTKSSIYYVKDGREHLDLSNGLRHKMNNNCTEFNHPTYHSSRTCSIRFDMRLKIKHGELLIVPVFSSRSEQSNYRFCSETEPPN